MNYDNITFIFYTFFVVVTFLYLPTKMKSWFILASSVIWYFTWYYKWILFFLLITACNFFSLQLIFKKSQELRGKFFLGLSVFNIIVLLFLKSLPAINESYNTPNGTSFFMLIVIGMVVDLWREKKHEFKISLVSFLNLPIFFPLLMAGPIERSRHVLPQFESPQFSTEKFFDGVLIFSLGFYKKIFISNLLINSSFIDNWNNYLIYGLVNTFSTYFLFSSYCDMGRGVAKMLGIDLSVNFRPFYYSKNPNDFWQRWNITLGTFIRDYVTFPLLLRWGRKINPNIFILFSFLLVGLWHGIEWNWLVFGLFNGLIICFYNILAKKFSTPAIGWILAISIWIGNGLLNKKDFLVKLSKPLSLPDNLYLNDTNAGFLLVALTLVFIFEYFQEKKGVDFYLSAPLQIKRILSIGLIIVLIYFLKINWDSNMNELPPMYFTI